MRVRTMRLATTALVGGLVLSIGATSAAYASGNPTTPAPTHGAANKTGATSILAINRTLHTSIVSAETALRAALKTATTSAERTAAHSAFTDAVALARKTAAEARSAITSAKPQAPGTPYYGPGGSVTPSGTILPGTPSSPAWWDNPVKVPTYPGSTYADQHKAYVTSVLNINRTFQSSIASAKATLQTSLSAATTPAEQAAARSVFAGAVTSAHDLRYAAFAALGKPPVKP